MKRYIISNPEILGGAPVIRGTRIPIARIIFLLKEGYTVDNIVDMYPWVKKTIIQSTIDEVIEMVSKKENASQVS